MKRLIIILMLISYITFTMVSCADIPPYEMRSTSHNNMMIRGAYHALILPFSVIGKLLGFKIGLYSPDTNFSYWVGYLFGIIGYSKIFLIIGEHYKRD